MKKLILILLLLQPIFCFAGISDIEMDMSDANVVLNDEFIINLKTSSLTGLGVISYELSIDFDGNYLEFLDIETDNTISSDGTVNYSFTNGNLNIAGIFSEPLSGSGDLINVKLKAIDNGTTNMNYISAMFNTTTVNNFSGNSINITNAPTETLISVGNYMHAPGEEFTVDIEATYVAGKDCISFQFDFLYDDTVLDYNGYSISGTILEDWTVNSNPCSEGISFAGMSSEPLTEDGIFLKLNFSVLENANEDCELRIENIALNTIEDVIVEQGNFFMDTAVVLPPENVKLNPINDSLRLSWDEVPNATYYDIYFSQSQDSSFSIIETGQFPQIGMQYYWDFKPEVDKGYYFIKACNNE